MVSKMSMLEIYEVLQKNNRFMTIDEINEQLRHKKCIETLKTQIYKMYCKKMVVRETLNARWSKQRVNRYKVRT